MIVRDFKRVAVLLGPLLLLLLLSASLWHSNPEYMRSSVDALFSKTSDRKDAFSSLVAVGHRKPKLNEKKTHYEIFSASSSDGKYYEIRFGRNVFNPNIIPHKHFNDTWHVVGQRWNDPDAHLSNLESHEVGCLAQFMEGSLMCIDYLQPLPIAPTEGGVCEKEYEYISINRGPHKTRIFFGPQNPYAVYGSNSAVTCFGMFIQDFRKLVSWDDEPKTNHDFQNGTEIIRPGKLAQLEKNYFPFWDDNGVMHIHWNIYPTRGFARLEPDGKTGPDLAPKTTDHDEKCLMRYMPKLPAELESIHQATNSLKITMCNRADKDCEPHAGNTYIMTIIQHKTYYNWHSEYEPYVVLFQQRAPFELYAISKKPLWISGRKRYEGRRTDMMYVTSFNWKERGVNYHGYLDDVIMVGFGYEDKHSGMIDVTAADLLVDIGLCEDTKE